MVETEMTDIGTGSYTIIAQTAAETLGVPIERVDVRLGDSRFPISAGAGGQWGANNSTSGVYAACMKLRQVVAQKLGVYTGPAEVAEGCVMAGRGRKSGGRGQKWHGRVRTRSGSKIKKTHKTE